MNKMMTPVRTEQTNEVLRPPADWKPERDGECIGLPVCREEKSNVYYSFWQPSEEDIANILAGVPIRLSVFGAGHPPVAIAVANSVDD